MPKILFVCTSNKDRSPALQDYFTENYSNGGRFEYRSAGINKYFCNKKDTHYLTLEDLKWADWIICAEYIHHTVILRDFCMEYNRTYYDKGQGVSLQTKNFLELNCGEYQQGNIDADYITKAEHIIISQIEDLV